ncbi:MAG: hypothetical protein QM500_13240 [Methylococcales bacterium]
MPNCYTNARYPFAQIFFSIFGNKRYNPPLPALICASRQTTPSLKPPYSIGLMEALCAPFLNRPTKLKTDPGKVALGTIDSGKACFLHEALFIENQISLTLLGASTKDAEKRVLHTCFSP